MCQIVKECVKVLRVIESCDILFHKSFNKIVINLNVFASRCLGLIPLVLAVLVLYLWLVVRSVLT